MLLEKSQKLIELSQDKIALQNYAENLDGFKSRQQIISQAVTSITPLVNAFRAFRQRGLVTFDLTQKVDKLLEVITIAEENFQKEPEWILDNKNFKGNIFISSVEGLINTLTQQLSQVWKNYLDLRIINNPETLNLLGRVDAFKSTVQKIRNLDALILREEFPKSCEQFENIDRLIGQLRESWDSLNSDEVPDAVRDFLKAAANQEGAPLTLLTPEVQEWITCHGISDSLRIRLA